MCENISYHFDLDPEPNFPDLVNSSDANNGKRPLTIGEVYKLQEVYGPNTVQTGSKRLWYRILFEALCHPFNVLLSLLAITSGVTEEYKTMGIMLVMVVMSTVLRFHQEWKSQKAAEGLLQFVATKVLVIRNEIDFHVKNTEKLIPSTELVPGDWVKLFPGDLIPADVRIVESKDFNVSQAALTGEAIPVLKFPKVAVTNGRKDFRKRGSIFSTAPKPSGISKFFRKTFGMQVVLDGRFVDSETAVLDSDLDRSELCFMGSAVVSGTATCVVVCTGSFTHFGRMATELAKQRPQNAFQLGVKRISWIFFLTMICLVPPVLLLQGLLVQNWYDAFIFALSVAVGLTPEMLPMIVNTTLAKGAVEMSKKKCIVKNLDAIINMGGIDVLCTDKTGTLTENVVTLHSYLNMHGKSSTFPLSLGYLNAQFQSVQQNHIDSAIVSYNKKLSEMLEVSKDFLLLDELPFDFTRRRISVILKSKEEGNKNVILICKGAVDEVLSKCTQVLNDLVQITSVSDFIEEENEDKEPITESILKGLTGLNEYMNNDGIRVIAVAYKIISKDSSDQYKIDDEVDLTFAGFLGFLDPPKESSKVAVKSLLEHNVNVKVLTGDSALACKKICKEIGIPCDKVVSGRDLYGISPKKLVKLVEEASIFAKLTPIQKSDIVKALKMQGHIVGFLGDGINDAPALTEADVGISVDGGTDICKESADMILLEKDLTVVVNSVLTGRITYGNTLKYIVMTISSNFGNVFSILVASAWLPFQPMGSLHILTQNLLYDVSQITIPWDHMDPEFLQVPHSWSMKSVLRFMVMMGPWSSIFDVTTFLFMYFYFNINSPDGKVRVFQTTWFTVGLLTQTMVVHMIRTPKLPFFQSWASFPVVIMTIFIILIGLILPYVPGLNDWLQLESLPWEVYPFLGAVLVGYCCIAQLAKTIYIKIFDDWY